AIAAKMLVDAVEGDRITGKDYLASALGNAIGGGLVAGIGPLFGRIGKAVIPPKPQAPIKPGGGKPENGGDTPIQRPPGGSGGPGSGSEPKSPAGGSAQTVTTDNPSSGFAPLPDSPPPPLAPPVPAAAAVPEPAASPGPAPPTAAAAPAASSGQGGGIGVIQTFISTPRQLSPQIIKKIDPDRRLRKELRKNSANAEAVRQELFFRLKSDEDFGELTDEQIRDIVNSFIKAALKPK
ncbi:MAG: hypothetical protein N3B15_07295, partial [Planctomycetota bacterium]|nr:hypothetical protein [Planctomycetota bacterium]